MKVRDVVLAIEAEVPLCWQESYDNAGLVVGNPDAEVERVLVALDITEEVVEEAIEAGAQMVVAHHPVIFRPIKRLAWANRQQRTIAKAIAAGVALYSAHTNLDGAPTEGISHKLAEMLGLKEVALLEASAHEGVGIGVVAEVAEPVDAVEMLAKIKTTLGVEALRHSPIRCEKVGRVAICSGSGGSLIEAAERAGADLYLSADFKYHDFVDADHMILVDAGHFETEICAIDILFEILSKKLPTFALQKSCRSTNPVNYML